MRKVKFTQDSFDEKLGAILNDFPILDVGYSLALRKFIGYLPRFRIYTLFYPRSSMCSTTKTTTNLH